MTDETIQVNGNPVPWRPGMTVRDVLDECNYVFRMLVVNVNGRLIKRTQYDTTEVPRDAVVEVVHMISGG